MNVKVILMTVAIGITAVANSMEQQDNVLKDLIKPPSLKFKAAWVLAKSGQKVTEKQAPEEVLDIINKLRLLQACKSCSRTYKKLFINLINDPDFNLREKFPKLIGYYLPKADLKSVDLKMLLAAMLKENVKKKGGIDQLRLLLAFGVDVSDPNVLIALIKKNNAQKLKLLIKAGMHIPAKLRGIPILIEAIDLDANEAFLKVLIDNGSDINAQDRDGETPLMAAADAEDHKLAKFLISHGADVEMLDNNGRKAKDHAIIAWEKRQKENKNKYPVDTLGQWGSQKITDFLARYVMGDRPVIEKTYKAKDKNE